MRLRSLAALTTALALVSACHNKQAPSTALAPTVDSIVLERTLCYGTCPAYRLTIGGSGAVTFVSRNPGDTAGVKKDSIRPEQVAWIVSEATRLGFFTLPEVIADDSTLCPLRATDHPTAIVSLFSVDSTHTVVDYHGCYASYDLGIVPQIRQLRRLEVEIDSIARSSRWVRPASR